MNSTPTDASVLVESDRLCDEFEQQFKLGRAPQIADFLSRVEADHRATLFRELVALEVALLASTGQSTSVQDYLQRYESLAPAGANRDALRLAIEQALSLAGSTKVVAVGSTETFSWHGVRKVKEIVIPEIDGFEIEDVLGRGGMGVVFKAVQTSLRRPVALKMILDADAASPDRLDRFEREATAVAELNDPHFVQIYEFGQAGGKPYMALEYAEGGSLAQRIHGEPQPAEFAARTVETLARAMHKAHTIGLIHRDLKPHNVLLAADGTPKIGDFGLVKRQTPDESLMTQQGHVLGTASYMAPEQTYSAHDVGPAADIYALGGILYCLLTGRPPFLGATAHDTILAVRSTEVVPPSRLRPGTPRDLEVICLACLEKEPPKRYSTAADLADDLRRYLDGMPIARRPISAPERAWRWSKRNPLGAAVAGLVAAIAIVSSVLSWRLLALNSQVNATNAKLNDANTQLTSANAQLKIETENANIARRNSEAAEVARRETRNEVLHAYHSLFYNVDIALRDSKQEVELRKWLIRFAMSSLEKVRKEASTDSLFDRNEAIGNQRLGDIALVAGAHQEALDHYARAYQSAENALTKEPLEPKHNRNLAVICDKQADVLGRLGETLKAREKYKESLALRFAWDEKLVASDTDHLPAKTAIGSSYFDLGKINLLLGDGATALRDLTQAQKWYAYAPAKEVATQLVAIENRLADAHYRTGNSDVKEQLLIKVHKTSAQIRDRRPNETNERALANACGNLGDFFLSVKNDIPKAWSFYKQALAGHFQLWKADQESIPAKTRLASIEYRVGALLTRAQVNGTALEDVHGGTDPKTHFEVSRKFRQELADIDPDDMQAKIELALALARCGRAKEAEERATDLQSNGQNDPRLLSQAAMTFALCSAAEDQEIAARCRKRAFEVLDQLIEAGWKDRAVLRDDPDLDPIRQEPRFQQILDSLPQPAVAAQRKKPD